MLPRRGEVNPSSDKSEVKILASRVAAKIKEINFKNLANSTCFPHCDLFIILTLDFLCFVLFMRNARHKRRVILSQCSQDFDVSTLFQFTHINDKL